MNVVENFKKKVGKIMTNLDVVGMQPQQNKYSKKNSQPPLTRGGISHLYPFFIPGLQSLSNSKKEIV
ncbi:hypothetical protein J6N69_04210 [bacterium]|nr:hypothetical protein [bacterium]